MRKVKITLELEPDVAAALARLADKFTHSDAAQYLYPHVAADIRKAQAYHMVHAMAAIEKALLQADVRGWPWVETGSAQ